MITLRRYLKKLSEDLKHIKETEFQSDVFRSVNIYFQDESRFGLLTVQRRVLTAKGIKPLVPYLDDFYKMRDEIIKNYSVSSLKDLEKSSKALASQSEELQAIIGNELKQLSRILKKEISL